MKESEKPYRLCKSSSKKTLPRCNIRGCASYHRRIMPHRTVASLLCAACWSLRRASYRVMFAQQRIARDALTARSSDSGNKSSVSACNGEKKDARRLAGGSEISSVGVAARRHRRHQYLSSRKPVLAFAYRICRVKTQSGAARMAHVPALRCAQATRAWRTQRGDGARPQKYRMAYLCDDDQWRKAA